MCVIDWTLIGIKQFSYISHKYLEKVYTYKHSVKLLLALSIIYMRDLLVFITISFGFIPIELRLYVNLYKGDSYAETEASDIFFILAHLS